MTVADERAVEWLSNLVGKSPLLDGFMRLMVNDYFVPVGLALVLVALWLLGTDEAARGQNQRAMICAAISIGIICAIIEICNHIYPNPRPFQEMPWLMERVKAIFYPPTDPSFPSNCAGVTFATASAVWWRNRRIGQWLFIPAFLMCFARVYAAVHYPLDIVGGAAIGILVAYLVHKFLLPLLEPLVVLLLRLLRWLRVA